LEKKTILDLLKELPQKPIVKKLETS